MVVKMKKISLDKKMVAATAILVILGFVVNNMLGYFFIPKGMAYSILIAACGSSVVLLTFPLKRRYEHK